MSTTRNKGATLIELLITTAIVSVILSAVYMIWSANAATAGQCQSIARDIVSSQAIINDLDRQMANLVITDNNAIPIVLERHSGKIILRLHTRYDTQHNTDTPFGPFIAEYELDISGKTMRYRQSTALSFEDTIRLDLPWQLTRTNISNIELEYYNGTKWIDIEQNVNKNDSFTDMRFIRIKWSQLTTNSKNEYALISEINAKVN
ncbi:MAG: prepilin-type N-terminal cleavage/methylation domain-containing protein [Sedimentisphaerales bacterium]|nr:prepilin-type N-terminal cleavage/methylation domain-containing protein [Sedimentisphaerales bacterium]